MDKRESKERLESRANGVKWSSTSLQETERSSGVGRTFNRVIWPIKINPFDVCCPNNSENRRRIQGLAGCLLAKNNATRIDFKPPPRLPWVNTSYLLPELLRASAMIEYWWIIIEFCPIPSRFEQFVFFEAEREQAKFNFFAIKKKNRALRE